MEAIVIGVIVALITAVVIGTWKWSWARAKVARLRRRPHVPKQTMRFVFKPGMSWWHSGTVGDLPSTQLSGRWHVTALDGVTTSIERAYVRVGRAEHEGTALVLGEGSYNSSGWTIGKDSMWTSMEIQLMAFVTPSTHESGPFEATVFFVDRYGNTYRQKATFPARG